MPESGSSCSQDKLTSLIHTSTRKAEQEAHIVRLHASDHADITESMPCALFRTPASRNRTSSGPTGRHFHGIAANRAGNSGGDGDLYLSGKKGWKIECGSASLEAAGGTLIDLAHVFC